MDRMRWRTMGRDAVMAQVGPACVPDRSTAFKLAGQPSCKRGFVDDWLGRVRGCREGEGCGGKGDRDEALPL